MQFWFCSFHINRSKLQPFRIALKAILNLVTTSCTMWWQLGVPSDDRWLYHMMTVKCKIWWWQLGLPYDDSSVDHMMTIGYTTLWQFSVPWDDNWVYHMMKIGCTNNQSKLQTLPIALKAILKLVTIGCTMWWHLSIQWQSDIPHYDNWVYHVMTLSWITW